MRILLALQTRLDSNSGYHVHGFASELARANHEVAVATPDVDFEHPIGWDIPYLLCSFSDVVTRWPFEEDAAPDILHVWTPRERMCRLIERLRPNELARTALVVHLEDNERYLTEAFTGVRWDVLAADPEFAPSDEQASTLCVPTRSRSLLASAAGVTHIVDALRTHVPDCTPSLTLWPGVELDRFVLDRASPARRQAMGIPVDATVLCYPGNVHVANAGEVRSLYMAVGTLNRRGHPAVLLRSGTDYLPFPGDDASWTSQWAIDLGRVPRAQVPGLLACADVLIQPGCPGDFNDFRLPSKIPEFLAAGRPVIVPATNIGLELADGEEALVLPIVDADAIADAVQRIVTDPDLSARLSAGGRRFAATRLKWPAQAALLASFYESTIRDRRPTWSA